MRTYQGAESNRLTANKRPKNQSADQELLGPYGADSMRAWARMLVRDNAYAWGVVDTIVSSVVGCGIKAQSTFETAAGDDIEDVNEARDKAFREWCETCEVNGQYTFDEIQAIAQREIVEAGEVLIRKIATSRKDHRGIYRNVPFAIELIEADRLATDRDTFAYRGMVGQNRVIRGVEVDDLGKPVAYWIYKTHPTEPYSIERTPERIPANEILHLFRRDRIGQTRGISWFAPVCSWLRDLGVYVDNELQASAVASCFTVAIKSDHPVGSLLAPEDDETTDTDGNSYEYLQPGMIMRLRTNESIESANPGRPNSASEPWISLMLRGIAVGTGLSYEIVARDYSKTTYSSSRTSQLEDRRRFRRWQRYLLTHLCQPIWDAFCDAAAVSGHPDFPTSVELLDDRRKFVPVEWQTPEWEWVDPQSEQSAAKDSIQSFMSDYQTELGARGRSWRAIFYQRAKEEKLRKQLGLVTAEELMQVVQQGSESTSTQPTSNVAAEALNGAQITSLVEIITQVGTGAIPNDTAKAIIAAAYPSFDESEIASIVDPIKPGSIAAEGIPTATTDSVQEAVAGGTGEMAGLSRLQYKRNKKAIDEILAAVASQSISDARASTELSMLGISQVTIDELIADVKDGSIDTLPKDTEVANGD